eukprot:5812309-Karenia_brevis.AAC.1
MHAPKLEVDWHNELDDCLDDAHTTRWNINNEVIVALHNQHSSLLNDDLHTDPTTEDGAIRLHEKAMEWTSVHNIKHRLPHEASIRDVIYAPGVNWH